MNLAAKRVVFDLNWDGPILHPLAPGGMRDERWQDGVRAVDGFHSRSRISALCGALSGPVSGAELFLLGPVSLHGLRASHFSRESARHRNVPACSWWKVVSSGDSRPPLAQHVVRRQGASPLPPLRRPAPRVDTTGPPPVSPLSVLR